MATLSYPLPGRSNPISQILAAMAAGLALFLGAVIVWTLGYQLMYAGRIFPGVSVAGVDISGLSPNDAAFKLSQTLSYPITGKVLFRDAGKVWVASPAELGMVFDPSASALAGYRLGREGGLFGALAGQIRARGTGADVAPVVIFDQRVAYRYLQNISAEVDQPVVEASLQVDGTNVIAQPGQVGRLLNMDATLIYLGAQLQSFRDGEVPLVIQEAAPKILDVSSQADAARRILSQPLVLTIPNYREGDPGPWSYDVAVVAKMLAVSRVDNGGQTEVRVGLDPVAHAPEVSRCILHRDAHAVLHPVCCDERGQPEGVVTLHHEHHPRLLQEIATMDKGFMNAPDEILELMSKVEMKSIAKLKTSVRA